MIKRLGVAASASCALLLLGVSAKAQNFRYGVVLAGDYPGDHPSSQDAAQGIATRSSITNVVGLASEIAPPDVDVVVRYTSHPAGFFAPGCGYGDIEAFSARSHQLLYTGKDTNCNFKFTWEEIGKQVAAAFAPGTPAFNAIQAEKAPPPPPPAPVPPRPAILERAKNLPAGARQTEIAQAEQEGDAALKASNRRKAFERYTSALSGAMYDDDASRRVREKYMKLLASYSRVPETPEDARRHMVRAKAAIKDSQTPDDFERAYSEMAQAIGAAPWWIDAYYNLGVIAEKRGYLRDAHDELKLYLLAKPKSPDARAVQDKVYELEMRLETK